MIDLLARNALGAPAGTATYFRTMVLTANLPEAFRQERAGGWIGDARSDAVELVNWALRKDINPADPRYTTLGSLLETTIDRLGFNDAAWLATLVVANSLIRDPKALDALATRFQIPRRPGLAPAQVDAGPEIDWRGPAGDLELQGWLKPDPDWFDVGFLRRAVESSASVCRIEVGANGKKGTGVLLDRNHVLTNYHVLGDSEEQVTAAAASVKIRFGAYTREDGSADGQVVGVDPANALARSSPTKELDFVLLRAHGDIGKLTDIHAAPFSIQPLPAVSSAVNILQHPEGDAMKLSSSNNGVVGAYPQPGWLQYVSRTANGSSGSPCFDDQWRVVALHHAVRGRTFGVIGEGILIRNIYERIKDVLAAQPI